MLLLLVFAVFVTALPLYTTNAVSADNQWSLKEFKSLVLFGDSYSDEQRVSYFLYHNGTKPPVGWIEEERPVTSTGGYIWTRYVSFYTGANLYNYAVSGAVCSNNITPRTFKEIHAPYPSVLEYEIPAFIVDKAYSGPITKTLAPMKIPVDTTVYGLWIGTNDLGNDALLTDSQVKGKTIVDYVNCVYQSLEKMYATGARHFVLMNMVPLERAPMYALLENGGLKADKYWKDKPANTTEINFRMMEQVLLVNEAFKYRTAFEAKIGTKFPGAKFALYDVWSLFDDIYKTPSKYLNGTKPANTTSWIYQCKDMYDNGCVNSESPDSYLWFDELHPSEQASRVVAQEFVRVVKGESKYATYWG